VCGENTEDRLPRYRWHGFWVQDKSGRGRLYENPLLRMMQLFRTRRSSSERQHTRTSGRRQDEEPTQVEVEAVTSWLHRMKQIEDDHDSRGGLCRQISETAPKKTCWKRQRTCTEWIGMTWESAIWIDGLCKCSDSSPICFTVMTVHRYTGNPEHANFR
jgi:hypothetical protein